MNSVQFQRKTNGKSWRKMSVSKSWPWSWWDFAIAAFEMESASINRYFAANYHTIATPQDHFSKGWFCVKMEWKHNTLSHKGKYSISWRHATYTLAWIKCCVLLKERPSDVAWHGSVCCKSSYRSLMLNAYLNVEVGSLIW